ncbi:MAG: hypothetical protein BMS9Abin11_1256 [Gammaproteobacteria bacterium]|nr:MAG: hypothetical protein BMS9Abin11_1256 [Gammaproteobacteria bacterium]
MSKALSIKVKMTPENKCDFCTSSTCCTYVTEPLDTPRSIEDFDSMLWQVAHENTQIYKDDEGWFLLVNNRCTFIMDDGRCGIYETRPQVCRDHTNDGCEFNTPAGKSDFEIFFPDYKTLLKYCKKRFKTWDKRFKKK